MSFVGAKLTGKHDEYRVLQQLGSGGMGEVYIVSSSRGNFVAKISKKDPVSMAKLQYEIEVLSKLNHPHVVSYIDSGVIGAVPFLVLEYVQGFNAESFRLQKKLDELEAKKVVEQVLLALDYIHSLGIVHRDVKPKNLIFSAELFPAKLIDFGTSTYFNRAGVREIVYSPGGYTAPEQYNGLSSPQADIWSVGALLFYLLTGQPPQLAMPGYPTQRYPAPPDPGMFNREVSEETRLIVMKAMSWNPGDRFLTARDMIFALEGEKRRLPSDVPVLEVLGEEIPLDTPVVRFGRLAEDSDQTGVGFSKIDPMRKRVVVEKRGDIMEIRVIDPYKWISRNHFEIFYKGGRWYIKDLGSLNRTAVQVEGRLVEVWRGRGVESQPVELGRKAVIYVAYGSASSQTPYLVLSFRIGGGAE
ncbi:FHA domain-containing serine/threonine-protein kinase [Thermofilum sp.]|uniref:FHA domain-containing serine/threonine-protein kinase n=1 Tax=Thermofilum sp. TaxID=1961369 RepID=UPI0031673111